MLWPSHYRCKHGVISRVIMNNLFLAKILTNGFKSMIFTDGKSYSLVSNYYPHINTFSDFLKFIDLDNISISLDNKLEENTNFLDLIEDQNIFATGCTYEWTKEKLATTPDNDSYKKIYFSDRAMFFYKGNKNNLASNYGNIRLRSDSILTIPEAEIVVVFNSDGRIIGHTIGNDVTAVDIEKQNPLFQMQAKFYKGSVSILPFIKLGSKLPMTHVYCEVYRNNSCISNTLYHTENFNRSNSELVSQLLKLGLNQNDGGFLFLGCGSSYPKDKGLKPNDSVVIRSDFLPINLQNNCSILE